MTSNVSGFLKAVGLSRTTTLVTFTMDIFFELRRALPFVVSQQTGVSPNAFLEMAEVDFQISGCPRGRNGDLSLGDVGRCGEDEGSRALLPRMVTNSGV